MSELEGVTVLPPLGAARLEALARSLAESISELEELAVVARLQLALSSSTTPAVPTDPEQAGILPEDGSPN